MGDDDKKKDTIDTSGNNKKEERETVRSRNSRSRYTGSYMTRSNYNSDSSDHSSVSSDNGGRRYKKKRTTRKPRKVKARRGRITKTYKRSNRQRKRQTKRFARDLDVEPGKVLSVVTIMPKASTEASSVTADSNDLEELGNPRAAGTFNKHDRKSYVQDILRQMRANRNSSAKENASDAKYDSIDVDED